ncbi:hypothetical protein BU15DRAFT_41461 [Melanogaster broomeanus]|nr:hypothetical protein BU15DRAFT_41461 [Melanogaster broomeanus]
MPQQVDNASVMMLDCITEDDIGRKLRVAGRMLTYDAETALVLLHDASSALLVDVSLCVDADGLLSVHNAPKQAKNRHVDPHWALERKAFVWVFGYLERPDSSLPIPILPAYLPPPDIDSSLVIRAVIIASARDLNTGKLRDMISELAEVPSTPYPARNTVGIAIANRDEVPHDVPRAIKPRRPSSLSSAETTCVEGYCPRGVSLPDDAHALPRLTSRRAEPAPLRHNALFHRNHLIYRPRHFLPTLHYIYHPYTSTSFSDPFRSSLHARQPMPNPRSRDQLTALEYDIPAQSASRFPISSVRPDVPQNYSAKPPAHPPKPIHPRHDPLHILSQPPTPTPRSYPVVVPAPSVAPGVLADGVLTAKLPSVRNFLDAAAIAPPECPPLPTDKRVLALVALSVFYHPLHPAHWAFWNKEQKRATATMIQSILDTTPTPILSPIGWIDVPENLWILKSMQLAYAQRLASVPWYATYNTVEPEGRMNLRKRKVPAILASASNGASGDETVDEEEGVTSPPPRKRARTRKAGAARPRDAAQAKGDARSDAGADEPKQCDAPASPKSALLLVPDASAPAPTVTKVAKRERIKSPALVSAISAQGESVQPEPPDAEEEAPELRKSLRQRERKVKAAGTASPLSVASTLTPAVGTRGLSLERSHAETPSRELSSSPVTPESVGGAESGSSTAVSLYDEEAARPKAAKMVEEVVEDEGEVEEEAVEVPPAKRPRTGRARAKARSRARAPAKSKAEGATETKTTAQARPKARSRPKTRRR